MQTTEMMGDRIVGRMRLLLATSAMLIVYVDPSEPDDSFVVTFLTLLLYVLYSVAFLSPVLHGALRLSVKFEHWIDLLWCAVLMALSHGSSTIFFGFLFFIILAASFRAGYDAGVQVVVASTVLFLLIGFATAPQWREVEWNLFLLRAISLVVIGYMIALWGGTEMLSARRLALLKDLTSLSNPRFGIDHTIGLMMERLRSFYDAESCLYVSADPASNGYTLRRTSTSGSEPIARPAPLADGLTHMLLALPASYAMVYFGKVPVWARWSGRRADAYTYDCVNRARVEANPDESEKFAALLDAESFVTVPVFAHGQTLGRLFLTARQRGAFHEPDIDFLLQVVTHIMPVIDNIRLVDRLASDAANEERRRIARDIHDSVIQPYIGLQIGLGALRQQCASSTPQLRESVERLLQMTDVGIKDLRRYVLRLKTSDQHEDSLLAAVQRFTAKFSEATGIQVQVESEGNTAINDRLAAEVFQMVAEGLSNVRRHTRASRAMIGLACRNGHLALRIENDGGGDPSVGPFTPRSIAERAQAVGGHVRVDQNGNGVTRVTVDIPL